MYAWQVFYRRNRQLLLRAGALMVVGLCALLVFAPMPGSGANRVEAAKARPRALATLLSPHGFESPAFVAEYLTIFR